jgi:hypothetical protein
MRDKQTDKESKKIERFKNEQKEKKENWKNSRREKGKKKFETFT